MCVCAHKLVWWVHHNEPYSYFVSYLSYFVTKTQYFESICLCALAERNAQAGIHGEEKKQVIIIELANLKCGQAHDQKDPIP